jgi:outer membrane biosynthesis protein TonB
MADTVDIEELDASDLADILSEVNGKATKVKNVAAARKELAGLLETKGLVLTTDDEGNFVLNPKKAAKAKAAPAKAKAKAPEPEEDEETEEETEEEAEEEETEEEAEEEEVEEEKPAPKTKTKAKAKAPEPEEDEEEEAPKAKAKTKAPAKDGAKRAPPPREPTLKDDMTITIVNKTPKFAEGSFRARKWDVLKKAKTVGAYMKAAEAAELPSARGFLTVCMKAEYITIA